MRRRGGRALKHAFLCSETCPVPLMARDLMCKLNLKLTAGPVWDLLKRNSRLVVQNFSHSGHTSGR